MDRKDNLKLIIFEDCIVLLDYFDVNPPTRAWMTLINKEFRRTPWRLIDVDGKRGSLKENIENYNHDFIYDVRESFGIFQYLLGTASKHDLGELPLWFKTEYITEQLKR